MKKLLLSLLLLAGSVSAQQATLNSPVTRPAEDHYKLNRFDCNFVTNVCVVSLDVKDISDSTTIRYFNLVVPDPAHAGATFPGILSAAGTTRATETGGAERRANFRIVGYLFDQGYLTGVLSVTP